MEISHEEEDGEFFLSFGVAGRQLARKEATEFRELADVTLRIDTDGIASQPGFIRRLVVLQKE